MSELVPLKATARPRAGKGAARQARRDGNVPAVIYGDNKEPEAIHVEEKALVKALMTGHFFSATIEVDVAGKKTLTLAKDVAFHPVTDRPLHADFFRINKDSKFNVHVPVTFTTPTPADVGC